jgi:hypothetical protein
VCRVLRVREDPDNWSEFPNVDGEVREHLDSCPWYEVYDVIEGTYERIKKQDETPSTFDEETKSEKFERELNDYFRKRGIGWQLRTGVIEVRGPEMFEMAVGQAKRELGATGRSTAQRELQEALRDLSRRPNPDLTGALQHGLAALECVARDVTGDAKATLGAIISDHPNLVPKPLDQALTKLWGFASERARHLQEGQQLDEQSVELAVQVAAATVSYLVKGTGASAAQAPSDPPSRDDDVPF